MPLPKMPLSRLNGPDKGRKCPQDMEAVGYYCQGCRKCCPKAYKQYLAEEKRKALRLEAEGRIRAAAEKALSDARQEAHNLRMRELDAEERRLYHAQEARYAREGRPPVSAWSWG